MKDIESVQVQKSLRSSPRRSPKSSLTARPGSGICQPGQHEKEKFRDRLFAKSYSIIYYYCYYYCYNYHHHYYYYYYYYYDYILCMIFSVLILSDNFDTVGAQRAGHTRSFVSLRCIYMAVCQNLVPLVNIKIAGIYGCSSH